MLNIIAAVSENRVIGSNNGLPWNIKEDKLFFKKMTMGKTLVMGRNTYESIGRNLKGRRVIVLSKKLTNSLHHVEITDSFEEILKLSAKKEIFIAGGETVYRQFLPYCQKIYLTKILKSFEGDSYFPILDKNIWQQVFQSDTKTDKATGIKYIFAEYVRK